MSVYHQSQLYPIKCIILHVARGGFAFASTETSDQVFINNRLVESHGLDVGDALTCWCFDTRVNNQSSDDRPSARWRAVRLKVDKRLIDTMDNEAGGNPFADIGVVMSSNRTPPAPLPPPPPPPKPTLSSAEWMQRAKHHLAANHCWTTRQLADQIAEDFSAVRTMPEDFVQRVSSHLFAEHKEGNIAAVKVYARGDQEKPSALYYVKNIGIPTDLIEGYEVDE